MGCVNYMLSGLVQDCQNSKGGIQKVLITTENPKAVTTINPEEISLSWYGFGVKFDEEIDQYVYDKEITNPGDAMAFEVKKGDMIEFDLPLGDKDEDSVMIVLSNEQSSDIFGFFYHGITKKNHKFTIKLTEDEYEVIKEISGDDFWLSIHLSDKTYHGDELGANAHRVFDTGKVIRFDEDVEWHEYNFKKNTSSFTSTLNVDAANGINFVSTELVLQFNKMQTVKRVEMAGLAVNDMWVCVLDCNNKWWFMGVDEPVNASTGSGQTGTAKSDGNFYQITLSNDSKTWLYEIDENAFPKIIPIEDVRFTQNPRTTSIGWHSITYAVIPSTATEKYRIYSSDPSVLKIGSYMNNTCSYEALKTGTASLIIESLIGKKMHSVVISVSE